MRRATCAGDLTNGATAEAGSGVLGFSLRLTAVQRLALGLSFIFAWAMGVVFLTAREPWLGLSLRQGGGGAAAVVAVDDVGPSATIEPGSALVAIASAEAGGRVALTATDVVEEPDTLETYAAFNKFLARQSTIHGILSSSQAMLSVRAPGGEPRTVEVAPAPSRPFRAFRARSGSSSAAPW